MREFKIRYTYTNISQVYTAVHSGHDIGEAMKLFVNTVDLEHLLELEILNWIEL